MGWLLLAAFAAWIAYLGTANGCHAARIPLSNAASCGFRAGVAAPWWQHLVSWLFGAAFVAYLLYKAKRHRRLS